MRIKLRHRVRFTFADPARSPTYLLRLTPRSHEGQRINNWRIDLSPDCRLKAGEDHFGNITHTLNVPGIVSAIDITVEGEISNYDAVGIVRGTAERLPGEIYLRDTPLTACDPALRDFADSAAGTGDDPIGKLHNVMGAIHNHLAGDPKEPISCGAVEAFRAEGGNAEGHAHVFLACARHLGWPARCVTGFLVPDEGEARRHAWAEVRVEGLGWIGFDAVNDVCPEETHIRTAVGLDALDCAAIRGLRLDGIAESVEVTWLLARDTALSGKASSQTQFSDSRTSG